MSDPSEGPMFCKDCGEEVFTSLEAVSGACLACSGFASIEEYEADFDKHFCFDEGFDDIPFPAAAEDADFDAIVASAGNWCECGLPRDACHHHRQDKAT